VAKFPADILAAVADRDEVELETTRRSGAKRKTIIWIVVDGSDVFVRSVRGEDGRWYQDLLANPEGVLHFRGRPKLPPVPFRALHTPDADSVARTSRAFEAKYRGQGASLRSMLQQTVLPTTLRLEPL
jgi:hypothetical protein